MSPPTLNIREPEIRWKFGSISEIITRASNLDFLELLIDNADEIMPGLEPLIERLGLTLEADVEGVRISR